MAHRRGSVAPPDGGWGWAVMMASFFNSGALFGIIKSGGVLYVAVMNQLLVSRTEAALIPSLAFSISCFLAPLSSSLCIRYSYRSVIFCGGFLSAFGLALTATFLHSYTMIIICYGAVMGFGLGLIIVPNIIVVHTYFNRHRAFASGFSLAGGSVGGFLIPPLIEWMIDNHGLFSALLTMSAIILHICPLSLLFRPIGQKLQHRRQYASTDLNGSPDKLLDNKQSTATAKNNETEYFQQDKEKNDKRTWAKRVLAATNLDPTIFRKKYFFIISFNLMGFSFAWAGYLTLLPDYALHEASEPVSPSMAAMLLAYMCVGDVVFRIVSGWILDKGWIKRNHAFLILCYASSAVLFGYTFTQSYAGLVGSSVAFGILISGVIILPPVLLNDFLGPKRFPMALGVCAGIDGIVIIIAAPLLAHIRELSGSYKPCFLLMALALFLPATIWLVDSIIVCCRGRTDQTLTTDVKV